MNKHLKFLLGCIVFSLPLLALSQNPVNKDSTSVKADSVLKADTTAIAVVVDTAAKKDCYAEYFDIIRTRGAKPVTDGMQQVVIAMKGPEGSHCFLGQIEVAGGKIKPPLFFQQENG